MSAIELRDQMLTSPRRSRATDSPPPRSRSRARSLRRGLGSTRLPWLRCRGHRTHCGRSSGGFHHHRASPSSWANALRRTHRTREKRRSRGPSGSMAELASCSRAKGTPCAGRRCGASGTPVTATLTSKATWRGREDLGSVLEHVRGHRSQRLAREHRRCRCRSLLREPLQAEHVPVAVLGEERGKRVP